MFKILRYTTLGIILLLIIPITFWLLGWHWYPCKSDVKLKWIFFVMQTVTSPWIVLTNIILNSLILRKLHYKLKTTIKLFFIINISIFAGQQIKNFIKETIKEPRPYIIWLENNYSLDRYKFYQLKKTERSIIVNNLTNNNKNLPIWLKKHWINETGFSLPSGHTIFATSWALLVIYLLWPYRCYKTILIVFIWACLIATSRLLFGMHWIQDLIIANVLAWILINLTILLIRFNKLIVIHK
ncbi:phosphatidylglycerophosphatase B [Candidatus Pantoea edessiphila]|uniref:undecaprenyl-diphosphate phosphatase n=1 Tax=Candidatus Pantoea edessiphila TaxID=2044610 RepID=A0A2P5T2N8_9GAMM|nr:phosphatidylglycerophosphatase B [Candidatus Pantoea edessiphila]PPI88823.1 phosphatidylglycerophosphatase B [Candidatus Pantoea edessiphila]